jgi:hypothetical protein
MAIEFRLETTAVLSATEALDYFAGLSGCAHRHTDTYASRTDLQVDTDIVTTEDDPEIRALLGEVDEYLDVTFRERKNIGAVAAAAVERDMMVAVARFFEDFPEAKGLFTYQGEQILIQRLDEGIVLDQVLRGPEHNLNGVLDELLAKYPARQIDQVFL